VFAERLGDRGEDRGVVGLVARSDHDALRPLHRFGVVLDVDPHVEELADRRVAEIPEQGPGAGVGGIEGLMHPRSRSRRQRSGVTRGASLHGPREGGAESLPPVVGMDPSLRVEDQHGFLVPRMGGGDDPPGEICDDPCVLRRIEPRPSPVVADPVLGQVDVPDVLQIACAPDRHDPRDVGSGRRPHLVARRQGRVHASHRTSDSRQTEPFTRRRRSGAPTSPSLRRRRAA
jgi:hypothetical protein